MTAFKHLLRANNNREKGRKRGQVKEMLSLQKLLEDGELRLHPDGAL